MFEVEAFIKMEGSGELVLKTDFPCTQKFGS